MDIYSLLENRLDELDKIRELFTNKEYEKLYKQYTEVINDLLYLQSEEEFYDFINNQTELVEEPFLLALSYKNNLCCGFGCYEDNIGCKLQEYIKITSNISVDVYDEIDQMMIVIDNINSINKTSKYIVIIDDTYSEGSYYIYHIPSNESNDEWESKYTRRLL